MIMLIIMIKKDTGLTQGTYAMENVLSVLGMKLAMLVSFYGRNFNLDSRS